MLTELDYFLRNERRAMESFMRDLARGAFTYAPPALDELSRAMDIDRRYSDLGLGLVDGSVIALAEGLGIRRLATRDDVTSRRSACPLSEPLRILLVTLAGWVNRHQLEVIEHLREENRLLKEHLGGTESTQRTITNRERICRW